MAKKPKKTLDEAATELEGTELIKKNLDTEEVHKVECCICGDGDEVDSMSKDDTASEFYGAGWRYLTSDKFGVEGLMCPDCAKLPDCERGED